MSDESVTGYVSGVLPKRAGTGRSFFAWMAVFLFSLNLFGVSDVYLPVLFAERTSLPTFVHVHVLLILVWMLLFVVQTALIRQKYVLLHKRLGMFNVGLAAGVLATSVALIYSYAQSYSPTGSESDMGSLMIITSGVWANIQLALSVALFVALAVYFRRRAEVHKRLMLLAFIALSVTALFRISEFSFVTLSVQLMTFGGTMALLCGLLVHDMVSRRRPHPVSIWGSLYFLGTLIIFAAVMPYTEVGRWLVLALNAGQ